MPRHRQTSLPLTFAALFAVTFLPLFITSCSMAKEEAEVEEVPVSPPAPEPQLAKERLQALGYVGGNESGLAAPKPADMMADADAAGDFNTEEYGRIADNPFLETLRNPLSTFSIDVDRASYSNVRRFLTANQRPPRDAVRIEEMVNYFSYDYPDPSGGQPFSMTTEIAGCPWNEKNRLLLIGLQGRRIDTADLPPGNLVFLIDVSGSMQRSPRT